MPPFPGPLPLGPEEGRSPTGWLGGVKARSRLALRRLGVVLSGPLPGPGDFEEDPCSGNGNRWKVTAGWASTVAIWTWNGREPSARVLRD